MPQLKSERIETIGETKRLIENGKRSNKISKLLFLTLKKDVTNGINTWHRKFKWTIKLMRLEKLLQITKLLW
jgi:hypothetical protein